MRRSIPRCRSSARGEKRLIGRNICDRHGPQRIKRRTRCRVSRKKSRAGPSSTDDWVLVKRALCKIPVLPGGSLCIRCEQDETSALGGTVPMLWRCGSAFVLPLFYLLSIVFEDLSISFFVANFPPGVWPKIWHKAAFFAFQERLNQKFISYHYP